jgi:hypothetical protein
VKRGRTERETCDLNGWGVGTRLAGNEGYGTTVIEITALGESMLLAKCIEHAGKATPNRRENSWTLTCREWTEVPR